MRADAFEVMRACRLGLGGIVQLWCRGKRAEGVHAALHALLRAPGGRLVPPPETGRVQYGILSNEAEPVDEVLVAWTGWGAELNCHGGTTAATAALKLLEEKGFAEISPEAWWREEVLLRRSAAPDAEAALRMPGARVPLQAEVLSLAPRLCERLRGLLREIETNRNAEAAAGIAGLLRAWPLARHILKRHTLAVAGAPNVGKSTTFNGILAGERALTSAVPGTTRDAVRHPCVLAGLEVELVDTAGLLARARGADAEAVRRARRVIEEADLRLLVLDRSRPAGTEDETAAALCAEGGETLLALNKADLPAASAFPPPGENAFADEPVLYSALDPQGIRRLAAAIGARLWSPFGRAPESLGPSPFTARQAGLLRDAAERLETNNPAAAAQQIRRILGELD
jgi:tRNA modification GTPase